MVGETDRRRMGADPRQAQRLALAEDQAEHAAADRRGADCRVLRGRQTGGDEAADLAFVVVYRERAVARSEQLARAFDYLAQDRVERQLAGQVEGGVMERDQLGVLPLQPNLQASDEFEHQAEQKDRSGQQHDVEQQAGAERPQLRLQAGAHQVEEEEKEAETDEGDPLQPAQGHRARMLPPEEPCRSVTAQRRSVRTPPTA